MTTTTTTPLTPESLLALTPAERAALSVLLDSVKEAQEHLLIALAQVAPSDDEIIVGHIRDAERYLAVGRKIAAKLERDNA